MQVLPEGGPRDYIAFHARSFDNNFLATRAAKSSVERVDEPMNASCLRSKSLEYYIAAWTSAEPGPRVFGAIAGL